MSDEPLMPSEQKTEAPTDWKVTAVTIFKRLGPAGPLALLAATMPAIGGMLILVFLGTLGAWLRDHGQPGLVLYVTGFAVLSGLALLPTYAQSMLGGWAFGRVAGSCGAVSGALVGSLIGYVIARRASGERVVKLIGEHPKWQAVHQELLGSGFWRSLGIVTLLRLPPNSPFAMTNLVLAATRIRPLVYLLGSLFGLMPRTVAAAIIGAQAHQVTLDVHQRGPLWMTIVGIVLAVLVIGIIGALANRAISRITSVTNP